MGSEMCIRDRDKVDQLILGGGIANTFLKAQGFDIGNSLHENDFIDSAKRIIQKLESRGASLPLVTDVICGKQFNENQIAAKKNINDLEPTDMIFDLGPETMKGITKNLKQSKTILWNGPCLLYTSPSPRDLSTSRMPSSA